MQVVPVGPLALSVSGLLLLAGLVTALAIGALMHRRGRPAVDGVLWWLLLAGVVVARAVFVARWWPLYAGHPLTILDLRDGGLAPWAGMATVLAGAFIVGSRRPALRGPLVWAVLGGVLVWSAGNLVLWRLAAATQQPLPALVLRDLDGREQPLRALRGEPVVINLWATWCGPCRQEMPVLAEAQRERDGVRFVFANQGESPAQIRAFLDATGLHLDDAIVDPFSQLSRDFNVRGLPTTLFFDARGTLRSTHTGALSRATLAAQLRHVTPAAASPLPALSGVSP